jgi:hypothetical protein
MTPLAFMLILLTVAIGLADVLAMTLPGDDQSQAIVFSLIAAQASLLALWLVLGRTLVLMRIQAVLVGMVLLSSLQAARSPHDWNQWLWLVGFACCTTAFFQAMCHRIDNVPAEVPRLARIAPRPKQFSLANLLLLTTVVASVLGILGWLEVPQFDVLRGLTIALTMGGLSWWTFFVLTTIRTVWVAAVAVLMGAMMASLNVTLLFDPNLDPMALANPWLPMSCVAINAGVVSLAALAWRHGQESSVRPNPPDPSLARRVSMER